MFLNKKNLALKKNSETKRTLEGFYKSLGDV